MPNFLLDQMLFTERAIREFAQRLDSAPGIVLGRLQYDEKVGWGRFNRLKISYRWDHEEN